MNHRGVTLVELLVSLAVMVIMGFTMTTLYLASEKVAKRESVGSFVQTENIFGQQRLRDALSDGTAIIPSVIIAGTTYTTDEQTLVFHVPSINASGDIVTSTWDTYVVTLQGSTPSAQLILRVQPDAASSRPAQTSILAANVADLRIRYETATSLASTKVSVTLRTTKTDGQATRQFTTDAITVMRNS